MEPTALADAARTVLTYISPLVAAGALAKIGEHATDMALTLLHRAWTLLTQRLHGNKKAEAALTLYEDEPMNATLQQQVEQRIIDLFRNEPTAMQELLDLARVISAQPGTVPQHLTNISGNANVGTVIVGDLKGNLTIGAIDFSRNKGTPTAPSAAIPAPTERSTLVPLPPTLSADGMHFSFGHALLIGIAEYRDVRLRVGGGTTANDARELATLLRNPQAAAYPTDQVRVLTDAEATRANILDALDALAYNATDGTALIMFAGHGEPVATDYALLPYDAELTNLAGTAITTDLFQRCIAKIRARAQRLVVLLNCCHSGGIGDAVLAPDAELLSGAAPPPRFYEPLVVGSGQVVISSSRPHQKSGARSSVHMQHTTFGAHLLDALRGKAPGEGAGLGVFELFAYLRAQVPADAQRMVYRGLPLQQEPLFYASQLDTNIAVALRPGRQGGTLSVDLEQKVRRLAALELQLALHEATAQPELRAERDRILTLISGIS